jgi:branched-subunit amino acid transport protein
LGNDIWANSESTTTSKQSELGVKENNPETVTNYISNVGDANTAAACLPDILLTHTSLFGTVGQENPLVAAGAIIPTHNTVAEFLYQLTKMLTDNNREVIEWSNGAF